MLNRLKTLLPALVALVLITSACMRNSGNVKEDSPVKKAVIETSSDSSSTDQPAKSSDAESMESSRLIGRWQRTDGNYFLQIFAVSADSTLNAGYFNPNTVNVESGEWIRQEGRLFIRIVLRDVNYPGSTYVLEYQPEKDILAGNYFQAVDGVNYDVFFSRVK